MAPPWAMWRLRHLRPNGCGSGAMSFQKRGHVYARKRARPAITARRMTAAPGRRRRIEHSRRFGPHSIAPSRTKRFHRMPLGERLRTSRMLRRRVSGISLSRKPRDSSMHVPTTFGGWYPSRSDDRSALRRARPADRRRFQPRRWHRRQSTIKVGQPASRHADRRREDILPATHGRAPR